MSSRGSDGPHHPTAQAIPGAANLIILVPFDLGLIEMAGAAALMACGVPRAPAVAVMLMHRVVCAALTASVSATGLVVLRRQLRAALHGQP